MKNCHLSAWRSTGFVSRLKLQVITFSTSITSFFNKIAPEELMKAAIKEFYFSTSWNIFFTSIT